MIEIRDYSNSFNFKGRESDVIHTINVEFNVGYLQLQNNKLTVICADGCSILVYNITSTKLEPMKFYRGQNSNLIYDPIQQM